MDTIIEQYKVTVSGGSYDVYRRFEDITKAVRCFNKIVQHSFNVDRRIKAWGFYNNKEPWVNLFVRYYYPYTNETSDWVLVKKTRYHDLSGIIPTN